MSNDHWITGSLDRESNLAPEKYIGPLAPNTKTTKTHITTTTESGPTSSESQKQPAPGQNNRSDNGVDDSTESKDNLRNADAVQTEGSKLDPSKPNGQGQSTSSAPTKNDPAHSSAITKPHLETVLSLHDFEAIAKRTMKEKAWAYYSSGADDEITMRENHTAFHRIWFRPRILRDVSKVDYSTRVLGCKTSMPVYIVSGVISGMSFAARRVKGHMADIPKPFILLRP